MHCGGEFMFGLSSSVKQVIMSMGHLLAKSCLSDGTQKRFQSILMPIGRKVIALEWSSS